jgi:hypothetical protein
MFPTVSILRANHRVTTLVSSKIDTARSMKYKLALVHAALKNRIGGVIVHIVLITLPLP